MNGLLTVAAVTGAIAVVALVAVQSRWRRSAAERLARVVDRLASSDDAPELTGFEDQLSHLESVASGAAMRAGLADTERARWQLAMDALPIGVVLVDAAEHVVAANVRGRAMLEARHEMSLVAKAMNDLIAGHRSGPASGVAAASAAGAGAVAGADAADESAVRTVRLTGPPPRVFAVSAHAVSNEQRRLGTVVVIEDRSESVRIDEVRRDFVANLSHELRTPVGAVALLAETLAAESDLTVRARLTERISVEADRMRDIIDDLLELSQVELEGSLRPETLLIAPLLSEVAHHYAEFARRCEIAIEMPSCGADGCGAELFADRAQMLRAVGNLVDNAIKYSDPGACVRLSARMAPDGVAEIVVADQGIGIPAGETERVFERFYRVDKARSRATGGTGLGLSIVRHVVANHGGSIELSSTEGVGTTFTLRLPPRSAEPPDAAANAASDTASVEEHSCPPLSSSSTMSLLSPRH